MPQEKDDPIYLMGGGPKKKESKHPKFEKSSLVNVARDDLIWIEVKVASNHGIKENEILVSIPGSNGASFEHYVSVDKVVNYIPVPLNHKIEVGCSVRKKHIPAKLLTGVVLGIDNDVAWVKWNMKVTFIPAKYEPIEVKNLERVL